VDPSLSAVAVVLTGVLVTILAAVAYLRRMRLDRPAIGVANLGDVVIMVAFVVLLPPLYLRLPGTVLTAIFAVLVTGLCHLTLRPLTGTWVAAVLAVLGVGADITLATSGVARPAFLAINGILVTLVVIGATNVWVQGGLRAAHVAILVAALTGYDLIASLALPTMVEFVAKLQTLPLTPLLAWGSPARGIGIGLGDLLLVVLWVLAAEKAFSHAAGLAAAALGTAGAAALFATYLIGALTRPVPAMVLLGPIIIGQFLLLRARYPTERTWLGYRVSLGELTPYQHWQIPADSLSTALTLLTGPGGGRHHGSPADRYVALSGTRILATAHTAAAASHTARRNNNDARIPLLVLTTSTGAHGNSVSAT
jgi:hypothetical protein